jgi:hypothetical protein
MAASYGISGDRYYIVEEEAVTSTLAFVDVLIEGMDTLQTEQPGCAELIYATVDY